LPEFGGRLNFAYLPFTSANPDCLSDLMLLRLFQLLTTLLGLALAPAALATEKFSFQRPLMGTQFTVVCYASSQTQAEQAANAAFALAEELNATASDYLPTSELALLSTRAVGQPIPLSPLLYDLLAHARHVAEATHGAFDPTLGPLTKLWRQARDDRRLPDPASIRAAREAVGWRNFTLDPDSRSITLHRGNMAFDLGGVAKAAESRITKASMCWWSAAAPPEPSPPSRPAAPGASVLLVERGSQLGGTMTTGGVAFPGLFDAWGKQIIAGIGWELVKESVELDGGTFPDFRQSAAAPLSEPGFHQPVPLRDPRRGKMRTRRACGSPTTNSRRP
jgi:hypothetical protein